ncbi:MAG: helix-turn-helix transcriptional regulator [Pseudomonadota bacterium]
MTTPAVADDPADVLPDSGPLLMAAANEHAAGHTTSWHRHARAQLLYAVHGVMQVQTGSGQWVVPPRQSVWIPPLVAHEVRALSAVSMRSLYWRSDAAAVVGCPLPENLEVLEMTALLREMVVRACDLADAAAAITAALVQLAAEEIARLNVTALELPLPSDPRLASIVDALYVNPADRRSLVEWGRQVGASERTLTRTFKAETGLGFGAWRQRLAVQVALARLDAGETVNRVALELGYSSPSTFVAMFRRIMGMAPGEYARRAASARLQYT